MKSKAKECVEITREGLTFFSGFAEENNLIFKTKIEIFSNSIYLENYGADVYFSWCQGMSDKDLRLIVNMINALLDNARLVYKVKNNE